MKINELLYFAPGVPFRILNADSPEIVGQFRARIEAYYLQPAKTLLSKDDFAFAATVLLASCIDVMVHYTFIDKTRHTERYIAWLQMELSRIFPNEKTARQFYEHVRCGAVHEARIKSGCVFDFKVGQPVFVESGIIAVNPRLLEAPVADALHRFCQKMASNAAELKRFQQMLKEDFQVELKES